MKNEFGGSVEQFHAISSAINNFHVSNSGPRRRILFAFLIAHPLDRMIRGPQK